MKLTSYFAILVLMLCFVGTCSAESKIELQEAIEIGKKEVCKIDKSFCNISFETIDADDNNTRWNNSITLNPLLLEHENIKKMELEKKDYWAIIYTKKRKTVIIDGEEAKVLGSRSAYVFIEKKTGKLIGVQF